MIAGNGDAVEVVNEKDSDEKKSDESDWRMHAMPKMRPTWRAIKY